jgi:hypothetical protein
MNTVYWLLALSFGLHAISLGIISVLCFRLARDLSVFHTILGRLLGRTVDRP